MPRRRYAIELVEDPRQVLARNALAGVLDLKPRVVAVGRGPQMDRPAGARVLDRVDDQVVEDVLDPIAIDHHREVIRSPVGHELMPRDCACDWKRLEPLHPQAAATETGSRSSLTRPCSMRVRSSRSLIIVRMRSASWRAARSSSTCLGGERADDLLEQEVNRHLHAGERRLELVADGRDHVALQAVEQVKLGHVGQRDGGADQLVALGADRHDARQEVALLAAVAKAESPARGETAGSRRGRRARR